ncbi:MAG: GtrA family protein [Nitrospirae bacterium]|nr:GtrA family protein [Nitrospirota bacterium]
MINDSLLRAYNSRPLRFLVTGGWNTAFSYISTAVLYYFFSDKFHYMVIVVFSSVINITQAYLTHKFIVFKTKGNYLKEYLRYYVVYAVPMGLGFLFFPVFIDIFKLNFYVTQAILTFITVIISWFGHKNVSFRT